MGEGGRPGPRRPRVDVTTRQTVTMPSPRTTPDGAGADALRAALRGSGLRVTDARVRLLEAVRDLDHPTVDALHARTAPAGIVLTTVYRTLETLEEAGLVWAVHVPGTGRTYHLGGRAPHAHLLCRVCGALDDLGPLPDDALADGGVPDGFRVEDVQLTVIGVCAACLDRP